MRKAQATLVATVLLTVAIIMISIVLYIAYIKTKKNMLEQPIINIEKQAIDTLILVKNVTIQKDKTTIELSYETPTKILILCYTQNTIKEYTAPPGTKTITIPCVGTSGYDIIIPTPQGPKTIHIIPAQIAVEKGELKLETNITSNTNYTKILGLYKIKIKSEQKMKCPKCGYCTCSCSDDSDCVCMCHRRVVIGELYENYTKLKEAIFINYKIEKGILLQEHVIAIPSTLLTKNIEILLNYTIKTKTHKTKCKFITGRKCVNTVLRGPYIAGALYNCSLPKTVLYKNVTVTLCIGNTCTKLNKTIVRYIDLNTTSAWKTSSYYKRSVKISDNHYVISMRIDPCGGGCCRRSGETSTYAFIKFDVTKLKINASSIILGIINKYDDKFAHIEIGSGGCGGGCCCCRGRKVKYHYYVNVTVTACKTSSFIDCKNFSKTLVNVTIVEEHTCKCGGCCGCNVEYETYVSISPVAVFNLGSYKYVKYIIMYYKLGLASSSDCCCCWKSSVSVTDYLYDVVIVPLPFELSSR